MSSTKHAYVVNGSEDDTSRPQNDRRQTRIDKSTNRETEKGSTKITERPTGRKQKSPSRAQGKGSSLRTLSVRKNTTRSAPRRNSKAQPKASTKSSTNPPQKPPKVVRFDVAGSQDDQTKGKQLTTTVEEQDSLEGARALKVMPDPSPSFLTQEDLEQMLPPKPLLPRTDVEFEDRYRELKTTTMDWVKQHFLKDFSKPVTSLDLLQISKRTPELIQYINFIASSGRDSWEDIFVERRMALVYGVLAKAIEIHVFGEEMFGASDRQRTTLRQIDLEMLNLNGFARQKVRAGTINAFLSAHDRALPPEFVSSLARLQARLGALVSPLLDSPPPPKYHHDLSRILFLAAKLSLDMRREPVTIYYAAPIASSGAFEPRLTDILNPRQLTQAEPWHKDHEQPVVRVAAWPSIYAYRPGNGRDGGEEDGFRTRRIGKSEAYVKWGSLIPLSMRSHYTTIYPANSEPNTSLRKYLIQNQQQLESSHDQQQQTETANQRTPSSVDRRALMAGAAAAAGGIGVVGAVLTTYGGGIAQAAGAFGGEAAGLLKGLVGV